MNRLWTSWIDLLSRPSVSTPPISTRCHGTYLLTVNELTTVLILWVGGVDPQTQSQSFASKEHVVLSTTSFKVRQLSHKAVFVKPTNRAPIGLCAPMIWWSVGARTLPASKTMKNLQESTQRPLVTNMLWGNICLCNLCVVSSIKECQQRKEMETISDVVNLPSPTHATAGAVDKKSRGMGGPCEGKLGKGSDFVLRICCWKTEELLDAPHPRRPPQVVLLL